MNPTTKHQPGTQYIRMPVRLLPAAWLFCIVAGTISRLGAQEYNYMQYTTKDGLAGDQVHGMIQDKEGFIWFATETGLSRFDGSTFHNFTREDGLPANEVFGFFEDSKGRLWIHSFQNAICYYYKGKIYNRQNDPLLRKVKLQGFIKACMEQDDGKVLVWDSEDWVYIIGDDTVVQCPADRIRAVLPAGNKNGNALLNISTAFLELPRGLLQDYSLLVHRSKDLYLLYDQRHEQLRVVDSSGSTVYGRREPRYNYTALLNDSTLWVIGPSGGIRSYNFRRDQLCNTYLPEYIAHFAFRDREGNTWFSTAGYGVFKLGKPAVMHYRLSKSVFPLPVQWIGKKGGTFYLSDDNGGLYRLATGSRRSYPSVPEWDAEKVRADIRWLKGGMDQQFIAYASSDFLDILPFTTKGSVKSLYTIGDTVLQGNSSGASLSRISDGRTVSNIHLGRATCATFYEQQYYVGTLNGLFVYNTNGQRAGYFPLGRISYFASDTSSLWVATYENGIYRFRDGRPIAHINRKQNDISSDLCRCLFVAGSYLWIGTDKGVNKIDITTADYKVISRYDAADGLSADIINTIYVEGASVYIGTQKGLNYFREDVVPGTAFCNLVVTDIRVSGRSMPLNGTLLLPHEENNIQFLFSGLSFLSGGKIRYQYRLLGLSDAWQTTTEQMLSYPSLPSGAYRFQIRAVNKFGRASALREQSFRIRKTIYEHWWFSAGLILLLTGLILLATRRRIRQLRSREEERRQVDQKMLELEHMALRAQMNPHFIFNCLNSIQNHIIRQDTEGANFYLAQFAGLVRQTLDNASRVYISLNEEVLYLSSYLELERLQLGVTSFVYKIDIGKEINPSLVLLPNMVIQPYVENAIKHGLSRMRSGGVLKIGFSIDEQRSMLTCYIEDNGPGIDTVNKIRAATGHTSRGMSITQERIAMLNKMAAGKQLIEVSVRDLKADSRKGTRVEIRFPLT